MVVKNLKKQKLLKVTKYQKEYVVLLIYDEKVKP